MLSKIWFLPQKWTPGSSPGLGSPLGRTRHSSSQSDLTTSSSSSSGLSFTACMSDFSLYVFHPYGAGKQKSAVTVLTPGSGALGTQQAFVCFHEYYSSVPQVSELQIGKDLRRWKCFLPASRECGWGANFSHWPEGLLEHQPGVRESQPVTDQAFGRLLLLWESVRKQSYQQDRHHIDQHIW